MNLKQCGLLLAAHGDGSAVPQNHTANSSLLHHVDRIGQTKQFSLVCAGVLNGSPDIETALEQARTQNLKKLIVFPLFMANGYFVKTVLAQQLADARLPVPVITMPPLGALPGLPALIRKQALQTTEKNNWPYPPDQCRLLVVGHGSSKSRASAEATQAVTSSLARKKDFAAIECCFLEEPPFLSGALQSSPLPTILTGFFSSDGMHGAHDIPEAIRKTQAEACYTGAIGTHASVPSLIVEAAKSCIEQ